MRPRELSTYLRLRRIARNPWETATFERRRPAGYVHVVQLNGGPYVYLRANHGDFAAFERVFLRDVYRVSRPPRQGWGVVIDVGGRLGLFAARISRSAERVISYEPCPEAFVRLTRNVAACLNVESVCAGVAPKSESLRLRRRTSSLASCRDGAHDRSDESDPVPAVSLQDLFRRHRVAQCNLLKLDVPGLEYDILATTSPHVLASVERIHAEYAERPAPHSGGGALRELLESRGFRVETAADPDDPARGYLFATR